MIRALSRRTITTYPGEVRDLINAWLRLGVGPDEAVQRFKTEFARLLGVKYVIPASNGRSALRAILDVLDLEPGADIIIPAYEDKSVPDTVVRAGFRPVFADIEPETQNIDPEQVKRLIGKRTTAVIVAHIFGNPARIQEIQALLKPRGIKLIEDCAHAVGTTIHGRPAGSLGDAAFFSFHLTKPFMTFGGGMAVVQDPHLVSGIEQKLGQGKSDPFGLIRRMASAGLLKAVTSRAVFPFAGYPVALIQEHMGQGLTRAYDRTLRPFTHTGGSPFTATQAVVGLGMLQYLPRMLEKRRRLAAVLDGLLDPDIPRLRHQEGSSIYFFLVFARDIVKIRRYLLRRGLDTGLHVMRNLPAMFNDPTSAPNTAWAWERTIQVPLHEYLDERDVRWIASLINAAAAGFRF